MVFSVSSQKNLFSKIMLSFGGLQGHFQTVGNPWNRFAKEQCNPSLVERKCLDYMSNERPQSLWPSNRINCKTMEDNLSVKVGEMARCQLIFIFIIHHSLSLIKHLSSSIIHHHHHYHQQHALSFLSTVDFLLRSTNFRGQETVEPSSPQSQCVASCTLGRQDPCDGN